MVVKPAVGKVLYAVLFNFALPALLVLWARGASGNLGGTTSDAWITAPVVLAPNLGIGLVFVGLVLVSAGMLSLLFIGKGLPMNPWPPARFVASGVYTLLAHPIYVGAVLVCGGASLLVGSAAGLWLVTPVLALSAMALVLGYEGPDLRRRFGERTQAPWIGLPLDGEAPATIGERVGALLATALPLAIVAWTTQVLGLDRGGVPFFIESGIALLLAAMLAGATLRPATRRDLRSMVVRAWLGTAFIGLLFLTTGSWGNGEPTALAFAALVAVPALVRAMPARLVLFAAIGYALLLAGPGWGLMPLGLRAAKLAVPAFAFAVLAPRLWEWLRRGAEWLANSWRDWRIGPMRIINHGVIGAVGCGVGVFYATALVGPAHVWTVLGATLVAIVGAALWAQLIEGSPSLARPYGFFGGVLAIIAWAFLTPLHHTPTWLLLGAFCVAGPVIQGLGRLRCIANGCCHGAPCAAWLGITYRHPMTRPVRLASLSGVPIHPTQLYSLLSNVVIGAVLIRLWIIHAPIALISGLYLILMGLTRFVEEAYRGEPQTPEYGGLRLYQWVSLACVGAGAVVTCLGGSPPAPDLGPSLTGLHASLVFVAVTWVIASVDFPESRARFARLA